MLKVVQCLAKWEEHSDRTPREEVTRKTKQPGLCNLQVLVT